MDEAFLRNELDADIDRRVRSLSSIRTIPSRYSFRENDVNVWSRCAFPIIYAEWEGFFVFAIETYIREINKIGISLNHLHPSYFVRDVEKRFPQLKEYPHEINKKSSFLRQLFDFFKNTDLVSLNTDVNTNSNLGFSVLNNILDNLNLEKIQDHIYKNKYSLQQDLDLFLLKTRNGIAHGNPSSTASMEDITKACSLVENLMNMTRDVIINGFQKEVFKIGSLTLS